MEVDRKNETMWRASHAQVFSFRCWDCFAIRIVFRSICFFVFGSCHSLVFSFRLLFFLVFLYFFVSFSHRFSFSMYLGYQCIYLVFVVFNTMAWHGIVHSACCITASYLFVDVLWPQSWYVSNMNNQHGHWMYSKLTARNNALMGITHCDETVGRGRTKWWSPKKILKTISKQQTWGGKARCFHSLHTRRIRRTKDHQCPTSTTCNITADIHSTSPSNFTLLPQATNSWQPIQRLVAV